MFFIALSFLGMSAAT